MKFLPDNRLIAFGTLAGALFTAAAMLAGGIAYEVQLRDDATASRVSETDHEARLRTLESGLGEMRTDVRETKINVAWIRETMGRPNKDAPKTASE